MMKHRVFACLLAAGMLLTACAQAAQSTYVFPYEGLRYTQQEGETVLTQTNLGEHAALIEALGTSADAILASYMASGIVMEVIPDEGGQIAVSVADAGAFADVQKMSDMDEARLAEFAAQFEQSGLYESCEVTDTDPVCVRLTSSAMYGSMPVYTLRYATLHLGRLCMLTQTVVGRVPSAQDDAQVEAVLAGVRFLSTATQPTASPTPVPTPTPQPTPVPTPGVAEVIAEEGDMTVEGVPAYTADAQLVITGTATASEEVTVRVGDKTLGKTTVKKDGTFSISVKLPEAGDLTVAVMTDTAEKMLSVRYEMPAASLAITAPENTTFTGDNIVLRGVTEPEATVYVEDEDFSTNVKANRNGAWSVRIFYDGEGSRTFTVRTKASGFAEASTKVTLTRELTEKEWIANFRKKMVEIDYEQLVRNVQEHAGKQIVERGKVMEFTDYDGSPCALICTENPGKGVWTEPMWVILGEETGIKVEDIITVYLVCEGMSLPADSAYYKDGSAIGEAPVMRMEHWSTNK